METTCSWCGKVKESKFCQSCTESVPKRKDPELMSPEERRKEVMGFASKPEIPFNILQERVERLVRRRIIPSELNPKYLHKLWNEAKWSKPKSPPVITEERDGRIRTKAFNEDIFIKEFSEEIFTFTYGETFIIACVKDLEWPGICFVDLSNYDVQLCLNTDRKYIELQNNPKNIKYAHECLIQINDFVIKDLAKNNSMSIEDVRKNIIKLLKKRKYDTTNIIKKILGNDYNSIKMSDKWTWETDE